MVLGVSEARQASWLRANGTAAPNGPVSSEQTLFDTELFFVLGYENDSLFDGSMLLVPDGVFTGFLVGL
jgi:hypothetical protein